MTGNTKKMSLFSSAVLAQMAAVGWDVEIFNRCGFVYLGTHNESAASSLSDVARVVNGKYMRTQPLSLLRAGRTPEKLEPHSGVALALQRHGLVSPSSAWKNSQA